MASPQQHPTTMENLPDNVLSDIFIRLLAKQLAQMRSVRKSWNILLSESSFIKSHLHHSIHNKDNILLFYDWKISFGCSPFTTRPSHSPRLQLTNILNLPDNPHYKITYGSVIGSVNGLICFNYKSSASDDYVVHILNPSLSATLTLPPCSSTSWALAFRFGYDPKTDDYKVVKLRSVYPPPNMGPPDRGPQTEVYSMRKGCWVSVSPTFPIHIRWLDNPYQVYADGRAGYLHWFSATSLEGRKVTLLRFDLGAETFCEIHLPVSILPCNHNVLGDLGGKICVMSGVQGVECEVWVMDEDGDSWVKNLGFSRFSGDIKPYGLTLHNELLFEVDEDGRFALYDPVGVKTKIFKIEQSYMSHVIEYVDSLVWIIPSS